MKIKVVKADKIPENRKIICIRFPLKPRKDSHDIGFNRDGDNFLPAA